MPARPGSELSREQLAEARDAVRRQIGILDGGGDLWGFRTNTGGAAAAKLREVLAELNEGLAEAEGRISDVQIPNNAASESHRPRQRATSSAGRSKDYVAGSGSARCFPPLHGIFASSCAFTCAFIAAVHYAAAIFSFQLRIRPKMDMQQSEC
jgi:hypothetical protein